jgi:hypothetical protein
MSALDFQTAPIVFSVWIMLAACLIFGFVTSFSSPVRFLFYNAIVLTFFCVLWYGGFYVSEFWMHVIDLGAPWSWLAVLTIASFAVSLLPLRKDSSATVKSLIGPIIVAPAFWLWIIFCAIKFDPFW